MLNIILLIVKIVTILLVLQYATQYCFHIRIHTAPCKPKSTAAPNGPEIEYPEPKPEPKPEPYPTNGEDGKDEQEYHQPANAEAEQDEYAYSKSANAGSSDKTKIVSVDFDAYYADEATGLTVSVTSFRGLPDNQKERAMEALVEAFKAKIEEDRGDYSGGGSYIWKDGQQEEEKVAIICAIKSTSGITLDDQSRDCIADYALSNQIQRCGSCVK